ncbi:hypothetical protein PoB_005622300 [Plakobranchus ocellatus]|uniref:Death domain-containing protein n=1 Tax=Plakobranchus ocellatus TaxID=259542 RepID=A0AAV4CE35_9GAST|nr:hypothetical protein PoB_005622300 [Plakobranchus ocellatus]
MGKLENNVNVNAHPHIVDEASLKAVHTPGRKGGVFPLPLGAKVTVPEALFGKKDTISCSVASPETRWQTCPATLPSYEHVNSEIYTFKSNLNNLKKSIMVQIPFHPVDSEFHEVNVKGKWSGESEWVNVGFLVKELDNRPCVELELTRLGTFLVTSTPKTETFDVTTQGCLYQARLSHQITVRFPKKAIDQNIQCALQIVPIPAEKVQQAREQYVTECSDVIAVTEFIDVISNVQCNFRRAVTIKLPLPVGVELDVEGGGDAATSEGHKDIAVLGKTSTGWELIDSLYKFSRTTVSFDVKELTRFCVVQCVPGRQKKMKDALSMIEGKSDKERGEICLFLSITPKSWKALLQVFPKRLADTKISDRKAQGFTLVTKTLAPVVEAPAPVRFSNRRPPPPRPPAKGPKEADGSFDIQEGMTWIIDVGGEVKTEVSSELRENNHLRYFSRLPESYRTFLFEPLESEPQALEGVVNLVPVGVRDEQLRNRMTFTFKVELEESTVSEYLAPEPVPEETVEEKPKVNVDILPPPVKEDPVPPPPTTPRLREIQANAMKRLTTINRPVRVPERESRALSGKSLMTLARLIPEGLTLAVHLQLPDSTITGIGFDALSNNLNMSDVSYKILLHWKRKCKDKQLGAVKQLSSALKEMNYHSIADAILSCHQAHKEFTPDCISHDELFARVAAKF